MTNTASDLNAKLLASENITVIRDRVSTASFDIKSRVLTLPQWKDMSPVVEEMLIAHEVGHALYTSSEYLTPLKEFPNLQGHMNIIEDVRIEKLIKRKYPGIRKIMSEGYKELNEKDFFGLSKIESIDKVKLIDKINLYFKAGIYCGVTFTDEEYEYIRRVERVETIEEVIVLAKEIYDYSYQKIKEELLGQINIDLDGEETDGDGQPEDDNQAPKQNLIDPDLEDSLDPELDEMIKEKLEDTTDDAFAENMEGLVDLTTVFAYHTLDETQLYNPVVGFKQVLAETAEVDARLTLTDLTETAKFKMDSNRVVGYLMKEFEMRKSAQLYKRAQVAKVGSLDMNRVWSYTLNEDLFKRVTSLPKGKNHGMIFLLDWSGSMDRVLQQTVEQVINLAMFCHRSQIPYQVFAFSSGYRIHKSTEEYMKMQEYANSMRSDVEGNVTSTLTNNLGNMSLLEFFSSKMTNVEFNTMVRRLVNVTHFVRTPLYGTAGTPLNEALSYMATVHIKKFIQSFNVEKMSFITLTDGNGASLGSTSKHNLRSYGYDSNHSRVRVRNFLSDPVTKKTYDFTDASPVQTKAILSMIKDRFNINSVGFYICPNRRNDLRDAVRDNSDTQILSIESTVDQMRVGFRSNGFASLKGHGRDDLFIVPHDKLSLDEEELEIDSEQNARQIAKNFGKVMSGRRTSRVLLSRFIQYVA